MTVPTPPAGLAAAVKTGELAAVEALLAAGAEIGERDEDDWAPLDWAAGQGSPPLVRALLAAGADPLATGADGHTAYQVALAAGRVEAARLLRDAERAADPSLPEKRPWLPYCRAYPLRELREFPGWPAGAGGDGDGPEAVAYVHDDLSVTASIWRGDDVLLAADAEGWAEFATARLGFEVPDELDLAAGPVA